MDIQDQVINGKNEVIARSDAIPEPEELPDDRPNFKNLDQLVQKEIIVEIHPHHQEVERMQKDLIIMTLNNNNTILENHIIKMMVKKNTIHLPLLHHIEVVEEEEVEVVVEEAVEVDIIVEHHQEEDIIVEVEVVLVLVQVISIFIM